MGKSKWHKGAHNHEPKYWGYFSYATDTYEIYMARHAKNNNKICNVLFIWGDMVYICAVIGTLRMSKMPSVYVKRAHDARKTKSKRRNEREWTVWLLLVVSVVSVSSIRISIVASVEHGRVRLLVLSRGLTLLQIVHPVSISSVRIAVDAAVVQSRVCLLVFRRGLGSSPLFPLKMLWKC